MGTVIVFVDEQHEEIQTSLLEGATIKETVDFIEKVNEFRVGDHGIAHEKEGNIVVDLKRNTVEVTLKER